MKRRRPPYRPPSDIKISEVDRARARADLERAGLRLLPPKPRGQLILQMLYAYGELLKSEGPVVVLLYGPSKAAVLESDAPLVKQLIDGIEEETKTGG